jgi:hypothetical protein
MSLKKLKISRSIWLRGEGANKSFLLRSSDGKKCCLGIYLSALGVPDEKFLGIANPCFVEQDILPAEANWIICKMENGQRINSELARPLMINNDAIVQENGTGLKGVGSEQEREELIAKGFFQAGIEVEFVE